MLDRIYRVWLWLIDFFPLTMQLSFSAIYILLESKIQSIKSSEFCWKYLNMKCYGIKSGPQSDSRKRNQTSHSLW